VHVSAHHSKKAEVARACGLHGDGQACVNSLFCFLPAQMKKKVSGHPCLAGRSMFLLIYLKCLAKLRGIIERLLARFSTVEGRDSEMHPRGSPGSVRCRGRILQAAHQRFSERHVVPFTAWSDGFTIALVVGATI
jgi:hypothetical protein